ncbi:unnamed protein product [Miscanthus lutarioriparius]|uniref:Protein kinase domain-containing protein n=1 Tax=Miscanthus lutarioriparius TaxID=422564 RepID=A0A811QB21_9POAL|nr:unnamed protein product [Miscanthus lutarioriparius]
MQTVIWVANQRTSWSASPGERIIHCDIKPENILLDRAFTPKIADFGMGKLVGRDFSRSLTTMRGTVGYLAPEWISGLPISAKADVYSFGMVLFELISGRRNNAEGHDMMAPHRTTTGTAAAATESRPRSSRYVPRSEWRKGTRPPWRTRGDVSEDELERACRVACWCIQDQEAHRPAMAQVVQAQVVQAQDVFTGGM